MMCFPKSRLLLIAVTALFVLIPCSESWGNKSGCVRYGIRVASCRNIASALTLVDSFNAQGLKSFCRKVDIPEKGQWCRVFIGTYAEMEKASEVGRQLKNRGTIGAFIIQEISDYPEDREEALSTADIAVIHVSDDRKKETLEAPRAVVPEEEKRAVPDTGEGGYSESSLYEIAMACFGSGRYQEALAQLEKIRKQGDSSGVNPELLLRRIADCHYFLGEKGSRPDFLKAINRYRNIMRDYPRSDRENETTLYRLAKSYEYSELYYEALGEFKNFSFRYPQSVYISEAIFMTAKMQYSTEQYAEAVKKLKEYLRRFPGAEHEGIATFYLAECYLQLRQHDDAGDWYARTLKEWPSPEKVPPKILMRLGEYFFHVGEYERALEMFSLCVNLFPEEKDCKKTLLMLAQALMKAGRPAPALKVYSTLLERYPESEEAQKGMIMLADAGVERPEIKVPLYILSGMDHYCEPVYTYDEMIDKTYDLDARETFISRKVHALTEGGRYQEAFACCDRLLASSPREICRKEAEKDLIRSSAHLVDEYYSKQDYIAVSELYFKTYKNGLFEDGSFDLLFKMGSSLEKIGLTDSAYGVFEKMLLKFSDRKEIDKLFLAIANVDYQRGLYERASDRLEALYAGSVPGEEEVIAGARKLAGDIYCQRNLFQEAVSLYSTVPDEQRNTSEIASIYKRYGDSLKEKGRYASAGKMYQDALAQCPGGVDCPGSIDEDSYRELADCFYREGKYERANALYEKVLNDTAEIKDVWPVLNMGRGCLNMGDRIAAEKHFAALKEKSADKFWKDVTDYYLNNEAWSTQYGKYIPR